MEINGRKVPSQQTPIPADELIERGVDPATLPTCSKPVKGENVGCAEWHHCKIRQKVEKPGPFNVGVRMFKKMPTGRVIVVPRILSCHHIPAKEKALELNGGHLRVIAMEGEKIRIQGTEHEDKMITGQGLVRQFKPVFREIEVPSYKDNMGAQIEDVMNAQAAAIALEESQEIGKEEREKEVLSEAGFGKRGGRRKDSSG